MNKYLLNLKKQPYPTPLWEAEMLNITWAIAAKLKLRKGSNTLKRRGRQHGEGTGCNVLRRLGCSLLTRWPRWCTVVRLSSLSAL